MRSLHPASLILLGFAFLLAASTRSGTALLAIGLTTGVAAMMFARPHFSLILRRSRWLLLTMLVLFGWMTPGTPASGLPAATQEGLMLAAEAIARLLIAIATVAFLLVALAPPALVTGLRSLLVPFARLGDFRDRLAVRLMLTLQEVEATRADGSEVPVAAAFLSLPVIQRGPMDHFAAIGSAGLLMLAALA